MAELFPELLTLVLAPSGMPTSRFILVKRMNESGVHHALHGGRPMGGGLLVLCLCLVAVGIFGHHNNGSSVIPVSRFRRQHKLSQFVGGEAAQRMWHRPFCFDHMDDGENSQALGWGC